MLSKPLAAGAVATVTGLALALVAPTVPAAAGMTSGTTSGETAGAAAPQRYAVAAGAAQRYAVVAGTGRYTVVAANGVRRADAVAAIEAAGGEVVARNDAVGTFQVTSPHADFATRVLDADELIGASPQRPIGAAPRVDRGNDGTEGGAEDGVGRERPLVIRDGDSAGDRAGARAPASGSRPATAPGTRGGQPGYGDAELDPLDDKLWGLTMVRSDEARRTQPGDKGVTVGILDTGVDASHPDLAPNFDAELSRNFAADIVDVDGECEVSSCLDPVGTDDNGHGTHVAGTIGAAADGFGISGVAPGVTLVELKGGQDSGYFFLDPVVNALTHAGDVGLDVVNMSFYVDPWLYNCTDNAADSPEQQAEQRATIAAMNRALTYAHERGVTLIGSLGNNHEDMGAPRTDTSSPNYGGAPHPREIDNESCVDLPVEGPHVIGVSAVGPSFAKADYSNYGVEQISVSAPGGWARDFVGTDAYNNPANAILSAYPLKALQADGTVDADGNVVAGAENRVFKECTSDGRCGYYTYLQGTSMASPHVSGVAGLVVSRYGTDDDANGGLTLAPDVVERHLNSTAAQRACPEPRLRSYEAEGRPAEYNALCEGGADFNGFYGHGMVDALAAVTTPLAEQPEEPSGPDAS